MAKELIKGNTAVAEAALRAGLEAYFGYPITPQTELLEHLSARMPELGRPFVQAESELGAINMVYGAACTGKRVMTSSSSPGVSLMMEGLSYIAGTEVPMVLVDVVRGGPGLGNIAPAQGDYNQIVHGGGTWRLPYGCPGAGQCAGSGGYDRPGVRPGRKISSDRGHHAGRQHWTDDGTGGTPADAAPQEGNT